MPASLRSDCTINCSDLVGHFPTGSGGHFPRNTQIGNRLPDHADPAYITELSYVVSSINKLAWTGCSAVRVPRMSFRDDERACFVLEALLNAVSNLDITLAKEVITKIATLRSDQYEPCLSEVKYKQSRNNLDLFENLGCESNWMARQLKHLDKYTVQTAPTAERITVKKMNELMERLRQLGATGSTDKSKPAKKAMNEKARTNTLFENAQPHNDRLHSEYLNRVEAAYTQLIAELGCEPSLRAIQRKIGSTLPLIKKAIAEIKSAKSNTPGLTSTTKLNRLLDSEAAEYAQGSSQ